MTKLKLRSLPGRLSIVLSMIGAFAIQGCSGGDDSADNRPTRTKVSGVVTLNGDPVADAIVTFHPTTAQMQGSNGRTDAEGKFEMGTFEATDGSLPGQYNVTITKLDSASAGSQLSEEDPNYDPDAPEEAGPKNLLPSKYADQTMSGLAVLVEDGKEIVDQKFELKD